MKWIFLVLSSLLIGAQLSAQIKFTSKRTGLGTITDITHAGDGLNRVFVANKEGYIYILNPANNYVTLGTLINLSDSIATDGEKGLLGVAFHPQFATNGYFFVNYNPKNTNHTRIARFTAAVPSSNNTVSNSTQKIILAITTAPNSNHKSGDLVFGPDGYLYAGTGDGGGSGDNPQCSGQNINSFLGKILRLNINTSGAYSIPATNPFIGSTPGLDEIWDLGLRNPWRISFDRQTNDLWIADVGQGAREEVNFEAFGFTGGRNYGWNIREGFSSYVNSAGCVQNSISNTDPIFDYQHGSDVGTGNSITGGFVYRGTVPGNGSMVGYYIFADYVSRHAWMIKYQSGILVDTKTISLMTTSGVTSFGEMENGEILAGLFSGELGLIESTVCNQAPTISLSSNSSSYPRQSNFTVNAAVNDPDGTIAKVDFYDNNTFIGSDNTNPYSYTINPANNTSYSITGKVFDNCDLMTTSAPLVISTTVSCSDGFKNGNETGVDCGGSCTACVAACTTTTNLSQGKTASQSTDYNASFPASMGNDGNSNNFCHTGAELQPWWQVDLGTSFQVSSVEITGRTDCCANRIKRFRIFISNSIVGAYSNSGYAYEYNNSAGMTNSQVLNIPNLNLTGRYVRIWVDNTGYGNNFLHFAEVKVMGCCANNQNPSISITRTPSSAIVRGSSFTIDATASDPGGSISQVEFYDGAVLLATDNSFPYSHTVNPANGSSYNITAKAIDNCGGSANSNTLNFTTTSSCSDGYKNGNETGVDCGGSCTACSVVCTTSVNVSQGKTATQSSNFDGNNTYPASMGNDGNSNNFCHTGAELQPWWQVDLGTSFQVSSVEITGRTDCCANRIKRFRIFISNSIVGAYSNSGYAYEYNNSAGMTNSQVLNIPNLNLTGRYVRIWVDNTGYGNNFLHFAEVKVMGCCANNQNPSISITRTPSSAIVRGSSFTIDATASDPGGSISQVEFYDGAVLLATDNSFPYSHTVNPANGSSYNITAKAIDNCGGSANSNTLNFTTTSSCSDGYKNGNETGVDCGGSCTACSVVCTTSVNVSQGKTASQSSNFNGTNTFPASMAVDGSIAGTSFNHTGLELQPWWQVDLGSTYNVTSIEITHRTGCPDCASRLKRFRVFISASPVAGYSSGGYVFEYNNATGMGNGEVLNIPNLTGQGRYVRIWADNTGYANNYIHLAEVKVMGCAATGGISTVASPAVPQIRASVRGLKIFPNPAFDILNLHFEVNPDTRAEVQIYDLQGKLMLKQLAVDSKVDIRTLATGSYIIRIQSQPDTYVQKLIKL